LTDLPAPEEPRPFSVEDLAGNRTRVFTEWMVRGVFFAAALLSVLISALIIASLAKETINFLTDVDFGTLIDDGWFPRRSQFDVLTLLIGSLIVTVVAMVVAGPLGLAAAVYLSEYAKPRMRRVLKPALEVLAGIPSVVVGVFAAYVISPQVVQRLFSEASPTNLLAAGIGVGVLTIPLVASVSEDALRSVPNSLREASYGMGARKMTTSVRVVIPAAVSGLVAALIIAVSRAIGETMVVAIAAGASGGSLRNVAPTDQGLTMTAAMAAVSPGSGSDQAKGSALAFPSLFFVGSLLFLITLSLNIVADRFVRRVRQRY
jgi:phosphate transport system permease protein